MRKAWRVFVMTFGVILAYRTDVLIWTFVEVMVPLVALAIWFSVASSNVTAFTPQDALTYYILIFFVRSATRAWVSFFLTQEILKGELVKYLVRPMSVFWEHIADNLMVKLVRLVLPTILLGVVFWQFPHVFTPGLFTAGHVILFVASLILAVILSFVFDAIFATFAFWIEDSFQIAQFQSIFNEFASGMLIPFAVMPTWLVSSVGWLPFRYMVSAPIEILMGQPVGMSLITMFAIQISWIVVSLVILTSLWRLGIRQYATPGQ